MVKKTGVTSIVKKLLDEYGDGAVRRASEVEVIERLPTGSFALDYETGGGFPRRLITELYGKEGSTKSSLILSTVKEGQQRDSKFKAFIVDAEGTFNGIWAASLGCDLEGIDVSQPEWGEKALDILTDVVDSNEYDLVALDSIAAIVAWDTIEESHEKGFMGMEARLMGRCVKKIHSALNKPGNRTSLVMVNQLRDSLAQYGPKETTPGGRAVKFGATMRVRIGVKEYLEGPKNEIVGQSVAFKTEKNKSFMPRREGISVFYVIPKNNRGVLGWDVDRDILRYGVLWGVIGRRGTKKTVKYSIGGNDFTCASEDDAVLLLNDHPDVKNEITKIKDKRLNAANTQGPRAFVACEKDTRGGLGEEEDATETESED
jgi:recombination protein RecA